MTIQLTLEERELMCHALGIRHLEGRTGKVWRNHFVSCGDDPIWTELVRRGYAIARESNLLPKDERCFLVTDAGCIALIGRTINDAWEKAMSENDVCMALGLPTPKSLTPGQKRYQAFLDADCGLTFGEWLKWQTELKHAHA